MECKNCGAQIKHGNDCPYCGSSFENNVTVYYVNKPDTNNTKYVTNVNQKSSINNIGGMILVLLLIIIIICCFCAAIGQSSKSKYSTNNVEISRIDI